jgi:hypothetical protein
VIARLTIACRSEPVVTDGGDRGDDGAGARAGVGPRKVGDVLTL